MLIFILWKENDATTALRNLDFYLKIIPKWSVTQRPKETARFNMNIKFNVNFNFLIFFLFLRWKRNKTSTFSHDRVRGTRFLLLPEIIIKLDEIKEKHFRHWTQDHPRQWFLDCLSLLFHWSIGRITGGLTQSRACCENCKLSRQCRKLNWSGEGRQLLMPLLQSLDLSLWNTW